jgi:hypothetical protein
MGVRYHHYGRGVKSSPPAAVYVYDQDGSAVPTNADEPDFQNGGSGIPLRPYALHYPDAASSNAAIAIVDQTEPNETGFSVEPYESSEDV